VTIFMIFCQLVKFLQVSLKIIKFMSKEVFGKQKVLFPYFYFYAFSQSLSVFLEKMSRDLSKKGKIYCYVFLFFPGSIRIDK